MTDTSQTATAHTKPVIGLRNALRESLLRPIQSFRLTYLPVLMVYFAYGALGLIDVSRDMWVKESLTLTPAELAGIGVWLSLPWTIKMVFGELVDSVPLFGSQRASYVIIGAIFTASGLVTLAGAAGDWLAFLPKNEMFILGALLIVVTVGVFNAVVWYARLHFRLLKPAIEQA